MAHQEIPSVLPGANDNEKLDALCKLPYKNQAIWFLNAFWEEFTSGLGEKFWAYVEKCAEFDLQNHGQGFALDEMNAHRFLEAFNETLTVRAMREELRRTGAIGPNDRPKAVPLVHVLLFKYADKKANWHVLVNASQGDNKKELDEAQRQLDAVQEAFAQSEARAHESAAAYREAKSAEAEAKQSEAIALQRKSEAEASEAEALSNEAKAKAREAEAREAEAPFKAAQEEVESALAEVHKQEAEYNGKIADAQRRSEEGGVVSRGKAKSELAQLQSEDPLPLRKAKITLEAAQKRAEKARAPFEAATKEAEAARAIATESAQAASQARAAADAAAQKASASRAAAERAAAAATAAKEAADAALEAARQQLAEAEAYLEELKRKPGSGQGTVWWMGRTLEDQRRYLPEAKGGLKRN